MHHVKPRPAFPPATIPRTETVANVVTPETNPFSADSRSGAFSTSLKGTRALLRRRKGKRTEEFVGIVEKQLRGWLDGEGWDLKHGGDDSCWRILDDAPANVDKVHGDEESEAIDTSPAGPSRRMPSQHQIRGDLPSLPSSHGGQGTPSLVELSRSPAHLSWCVTDGFERLITHLLVRYYELISWSEYPSHQQIRAKLNQNVGEDHRTPNGVIRITNIIIPTIALPKALPKSYALHTPETSDLSAPSSSDIDSAPTSDFTVSDDDSVSDAGTEMGYSLYEGDTTAGANIDPDQLADRTERLEIGSIEALRRVPSNSSSTYASASEDGGSDYGGMMDSLTLPTSGPLNGGWTTTRLDPDHTDTESEYEAVINPTVAAREFRESHLGRMGGRGWEEKPTFFEYLYGQ